MNNINLNYAEYQKKYDILDKLALKAISRFQEYQIEQHDHAQEVLNLQYHTHSTCL